MNDVHRRLDGFDFTLALEVMGRDRIPYPLAYMPPRMEHDDDYQRYRQQCARRLQSMFDEPLYQALTILLEPEIRVEIYGTHDSGSSAVVRMYAGVVGRVAVLATQLPGRTRDYGGDIIVAQYRSDQLATQLVAGLSPLAPGTHQPIRARRSDLHAPVYSRHSTQLSPVEDMQGFFRRPRTGTGEITVYPDYTIDARPTDDGRAFLWLDYPDGRYLLHHHNEDDFTLTPGSPEEIQRQLRGCLEATSRTRTGTTR